MHANAVPTSIPPPIPCKPRASTSDSMSCAIAHSTDAPVNTTSDAITNGLRP
ncbi:hypothetical protein DP42_4548 [Burkholderia pseudomallei]|nr:hypothetical protein DP42_4548 [Burkholderia pseudomallei]